MTRSRATRLPLQRTPNVEVTWITAPTTDAAEQLPEMIGCVSRNLRDSARLLDYSV